jgi:hypothetical protein
MFKIVDQNIGKVIPKKEYTVYFEYENIQSIDIMTSPCDCSLIYNDKKNNRIKILYTPKNLAPQVLAEGKNHATYQKNFVITYTGTDLLQRQETLSFTSTVVDRL